MRVAADSVATNSPAPVSLRRRAWTKAFVLLLAVVISIALAAAAISKALGPAAKLPPGVQEVRQAEFCKIDGLQDTLPGPSCPWATVDLPKTWYLHKPKVLQDAWLKADFALEHVPSDGLALFARTFNRAGRIFINGIEVRAVGSMVEPMPLNWNRGQLVVLPSAVLRQGSNAVVVQIRARLNDEGGLGPLVIGPEPVVRKLYDWRVAWQNESVALLAATTGALGLAMLGVWVLRRSEKAFFWFGLTCLMWVVNSVDYYAAYPPLPDRLWDGFVLVAQVLRACVMMMFCMRYANRGPGWVTVAIWTYFTAGAVGMFTTHGTWVTYWFLGVLVASPYFISLLVMEGLRRSLVEGALLAIAALTHTILSGYDIWLYDVEKVDDRIYMAHFSVSLYISVVGLILIRQFVSSLRAYENLNARLELRVQEKSAELAANYERLAVAERAELLAGERSRIMSEMHDGIGSQLTMALSTMRGRERVGKSRRDTDDVVKRVLEESIDDLQLIVDSLEPVDHDLLTVLGMVRYRIQDRLKHAGLELAWGVEDLPPLPMLTPNAVLSVLRITQEAFANALKHSRARRIVVTTGLVDAGEAGLGERAFVRISDDGYGIDVGRVGGRGLGNMRMRAATFGGAVDIESSPAGTSVTLTIPMERPAQSG